MNALIVTFTLATIILSLSITHIMDGVSGHEATLGLPANVEFVPWLIGLVMSLVAAGVLIAPFAFIMNARSKRRGRRPRRVR